jgi:ribosomal protein S18 acetylase RimI-like enzyme
MRERNASGSADDYAAFQRAWAELRLDQEPPPREAFACHLAPHAFFLEDERGEIAAYALVRGYGARGDVRQIVVLPGWRRRGVGGELMATVAARLGRAGCADWRLEVRADNRAAIALYRSVGMEVRRPLTVLRLGEDARRRLARRAALPLLTPDQEGGCEDAFDLGRGWLAALRARRPDLPMRGGPDGLVRWMPDFTGRCGLLFPFRARAAEVAASLLGAAPEASGEAELMAVDAGIAAWLEAAGARVHDRLLEMGGPLRAWAWGSRAAQDPAAPRNRSP